MLRLKSIILYTVDMLLRILHVLEERSPPAFDGGTFLVRRVPILFCIRVRVKENNLATHSISQTTSLSLRRYIVKRFIPPD